MVKLRELSADERARDLYEGREKALRDIADEKRWALKKQAFDIAKAFLCLGDTVDISDIC